MLKGDQGHQLNLLRERVDALLGLRPNARNKQALTAEDRAAIILDARTLATQEVSASVPVGSVMSFAGNAPPPRFLRLDGALISRSAYAALWAYAQGSGVLAASESGKAVTQFGPGDGATTFSLPNHTATERQNTVLCIRH